MTQQIDDLEAVRTIAATLEKFNKNDQERIIRWACEKLGFETPQSQLLNQQQVSPQASLQNINNQFSGTVKDLKSFVNEKNPSSDMQFAATVAYYYKFEAPVNERKDLITNTILQDAARLSNRARLSDPGQTLRNAKLNGMLDGGDEKGTFKINTVGENLVAMTLPQNSTSKRNVGTRKIAQKKAPTKPSKKNNK